MLTRGQMDCPLGYTVEEPGQEDHEKNRMAGIPGAVVKPAG